MYKNTKLKDRYHAAIITYSDAPNQVVCTVLVYVQHSSQDNLVASVGPSLTLWCLQLQRRRPLEAPEGFQGWKEMPNHCLQQEVEQGERSCRPPLF